MDNEHIIPLTDVELMAEEEKKKRDGRHVEEDKANEAEMQSMLPVMTLRTLDANLHNQPLPEGYCRVNTGKLVVPRKVADFLEETARRMEIRPTTIYQALMMEALSTYIDKLQKMHKMEEDAREQMLQHVLSQTEAFNTQSEIEGKA